MTTLEWVAVIGGLAMVGAGAVGLLRRRRAPARVPATTSTAAVAELLAGTARRRRHATPSSATTDLRSEVEAGNDARETEVDARHILDALADVRDACGGEEAVLWRWDESRDALIPASWSTPDADRPRHFRMEDWGPLARWAAEGRLVVFDGTDAQAAPCLAAAPLIDQALLVGVLTVSHAGGLAISRARAKDWMPRYARGILSLVTLSESRREYARQMRQSRALLTAVRQIGAHNTQDTLAPSLCETALEVSSAGAAALVRWRSDFQKGSVRFATHGFRHRPPYPLDTDTLVANACRDNQVLFLPDSSQLGPGVSLFFTGDGGWPEGSLGIVPLNRDGRVIGAIVVASPETDRITHDEVRNLTDLGVVAATSLEIVWEIDEVTRKASTDGLTGLVNRRAFDEHLKRLLNETDRFGQPLALILADIDHFKRINDTWGHEAGDEVLRRVSRKLVEGVRNVDVVARYGGEEIAILLPQTSLVGATDLADRLRHAVGAQPVKFKGEEIAVTISLGVASYPDAVPAREVLFRSADRALYEAKKAGRNCVKAVAVSASGGGA
ncbi:MAG: GGDEF domain-containing protein [Gemmatimonadota bacterium]|nr:GGDEF domain-containing protein [Gemmatimonadota bacterium]MDE3214817.1 GGDEF domain-containing protein [Gemmatimonadota bacterium]